MVAPLTTQKPLFAATTRKAISYPSIMAVIGQREVEAGVIAVRSRKNGEEGTMTSDDFIARLQSEIHETLHS